MKQVVAALLMSTASAWAPVPHGPVADVAAQALSCTPRRLCSQIPTCEEAQWYLRHCAWGHRLDADDDDIPCETICGSSP